MRRARLLSISFVVMAALNGDLEAQSAQAISVQVSGLYNGVFGNVFTYLNDGVGGEAQIRYTPGAFSIGAGFQYTIHGLDMIPGLDLPPEKAMLYGGFIEPRYRIHTGSNVLAPYLSARLSLLKIRFSGGDLSTTANFVQLNGGGGLLYRLGSRVNLDVGGTYGYNRVGSGTRRSVRNGTTSFRSSSGSNVVFRLGFAVGIGG
jgi:hypothetical protein